MRLTIRLLPLFALLTFVASARALELARVDLPINDLVYDRFDGWLYVSVPSTAPSHGNTITRIDPVTGAISASLTVGSEPGALALSDDGTRLYVALNGSASVRPVDLTSFTAGTAFTLGNDPFFGPNYAEDIAVQPGHPSVVAISLMNPGISPRHAGVAVFENGVARPTVTARHTGSNRIEFSSDPSRLYGYNNESTEFGFRRMNVTSSGVTVLDVTQNLITGFSNEIVYDRGRIYSSNGQVIDPENRSLLGSFALPTYAFRYAVAPDSDKAYFATGEGGGLQLSEYRSDDFTLVLRQGIPGIPEGATKLVRWGVEGLAMRIVDLYGTPRGVVILRRIHEPPTADLEVRQQDSSDPLDLGMPLTYTITVRNLGPSPAEAVVLRARHPAGYQYAYSSRGAAYDSSGTVVCTLGGIANGDSATLWVSVVPPSTGTIENRVSVVSATLDPEPRNNESVETTVVRTPPSADVFLRVISAPRAASVDHPTTITLRAGNLGPDVAEAAWFQASSYYGVATSVVSIQSPSGICSDTSSIGHLTCAFGDIAPADSFDVVVVLRPREVGAMNALFALWSPVADPDYPDGTTIVTLPVLPAADELIGALLVLVRGYELKNGPEHTMVEALKSALDALRIPDTTACCSAMMSFRDEVERRAGRALAVPQAYALLEGSGLISSVLECDTHTRSVRKPGVTRAAVATMESADPPMPDHLALHWIASAPGRRTLEWSLPAPGRVVVAVHDVQGRNLGTLQDGDQAAGTHRLEWDGRQVAGRSIAPGVYFLRLTSGGRSTVMKADLAQ